MTEEQKQETPQTLSMTEIIATLAMVRAQVMTYPKTRELSLAVTRIEEGCLWINAHQGRDLMRLMVASGKSMGEVVQEAHAEVMEAINAHTKPDA